MISSHIFLKTRVLTDGLEQNSFTGTLEFLSRQHLSKEFSSLPEPLPFGENGGGRGQGSARRAHKPKARSLGNRPLVRAGGKALSNYCLLTSLPNPLSDRTNVIGWFGDAVKP